LPLLLQAQKIKHIIPDVAHQTETITLSISGSGCFAFYVKPSTIYLASDNTLIYGKDITIVNDSLIKVTFSFDLRDLPGKYDVIGTPGSNNITRLYNGFVLYESNTLSVREIKKDQLMDLFPNPSSGVVTANVVPELEGAVLTFYNSMGNRFAGMKRLALCSRLTCQIARQVFILRK
jgi:hypothetical protein